MNNILLFLLLLIFGCKETNQTAVTAEISKDTVPKPTIIKTEVTSSEDDEGAMWLIEVIESHLNTGGFAMEDICTPRYNEYKSDATQVGYDGGMDEAQFQKKWSKTYNTKYAGLGAGFLISGQDWTEIKVIECKRISALDSNPLVYHVVMEDKAAKATYTRDIKIVPVTKAFQIDDVLEYE